MGLLKSIWQSWQVQSSSLFKRSLNNENVLEIYVDSAFESCGVLLFFMLDLDQSLAGKSSWEMVSLEMEVNSPRFPVLDLIQGQQYLFRVRSINRHGVSDPSEPSAPVSLGKQEGEKCACALTLPLVEVDGIL